MKKNVAAIILLCGVLTGCAGVVVPGSTEGDRTVSYVENSGKSVTFYEPVVWLNSPVGDTTKGIRLPKGTYKLEAEDSEYLYFRAPTPIELRILKGGKQIDGRNIPGGLMLGKSEFMKAPAGAYIDAENKKKILVMRIGCQFFMLENNKWKRSN